MKLPMQIVDDQDNLISVKDRTDVNYQQDIYRVSSLIKQNPGKYVSQMPVVAEKFL